MQRTKVIAHYLALPIAEARAAWIDRSRLESGRVADTKTWMEANGFEVISEVEGKVLAADGREILHEHGKAWVLRPEVHTQRLADAMEQARQRDEALAEQRSQSAHQAPLPTICTSLIDGQLCGGYLAMTPVCPNCALGKSGVRATMTCDVCGHITAVMREVSHA